jgi:hypothetical protein
MAISEASVTGVWDIMQPIPGCIGAYSAVSFVNILRLTAAHAGGWRCNVVRTEVAVYTKALNRKGKGEREGT